MYEGLSDGLGEELWEYLGAELYAAILPSLTTQFAVILPSLTTQFAAILLSLKTQSRKWLSTIWALEQVEMVSTNRKALCFPW